MSFKQSSRSKAILISLIPALAAVLAATSPAHAVKVGVTGQITGTSVTFNGSSDIGILSKKGTVSGKLSTGETCSGTASVDGAFKNGSGDLSCKDGRTAKFNFTLTSKVPPKGTGSGKTNKGETITFVFGK